MSHALLDLSNSEVPKAQENRQQLSCLYLNQFWLHLVIHQKVALLSDSYN